MKGSDKPFAVAISAVASLLSYVCRHDTGNTHLLPDVTILPMVKRTNDWKATMSRDTTKFIYKRTASFVA